MSRSYLILPGLYAKDPQLKFSSAVLSVFVVALLTAGYSFTALLCFACRNERFQAESIFLHETPPSMIPNSQLTMHHSPALASSALGLLTIAYNFLASRAYEWSTPAISGTVISATSSVLYGALLLWTHRRIIKSKEKADSRSNMWSEQSYYSNFITNMYPTSSRSPSAAPEVPLSEDDRINQQMALLLMKNDNGASPDASSATFRIDLPDNQEERERMARSQELVGTPPADWNRERTDSSGRPTRPDSLGEQQAWARWQARGRPTDRPPSVESRGHHSRNVSREERRREIELGQVHS
jgi:hypothetical protein